MLLLTSCVSLPWSAEQPANEINLAFTIQNNLLFLTTATVNKQPGRIFFGSAEPHTVLDPAYAGRVRAGSYALDLNERESIPFTPVVTSLHGIGDAVVGADVWGNHAVTIDYRSGLLTYQKEGIYPAYMTLFRFDAAPAITVEVDGRPHTAVLDTALPDTLVLPRADTAAGRSRAHVVVAGTDFGSVDIAYADVSQPRIGNRLLSKFLISVDYGHRQIGLWRDPRIPM